MTTDWFALESQLGVWADECDDIMDHDELHAGAMVAYEIGVGNVSSHPYLVRWLEGLYGREKAIRERENRE